MSDSQSPNDASSEVNVQAFALRSLYRDENSYPGWANPRESTLRVCFAREQFTDEIADEWGPATVVNLSTASHEPVELYQNDRLVARGILVTKRGRLGIKVTEVVDEATVQPPTQNTIPNADNVSRDAA